MRARIVQVRDYNPRLPHQEVTDLELEPEHPRERRKQFDLIGEAGEFLGGFQLLPEAEFWRREKRYKE